MSGPDLLAEVHADQRAAGEPVRAGARPADVARAARDLRAMGLALPPDHAAWLARSDGLDWDGLLLYGCGPGAEVPALAEANALWREGGEMPGLVLGEDGDDLLLAAGANAMRRDRVSLDVSERFGSAVEMIAEAIARRLPAGRPEDAP